MPFLDDLQERLSQLQIRTTDRDALYLETYPSFRHFFKNRIAVPDLKLHDAKIAVTLVYSWMGRAKRDPSCWVNFAKARRSLDLLRKNDCNVERIDSIRSFVGNSLIATSKFLHFFDPTRYAIWDINVARAAYGYTYSQLNVTSRYLEYLSDLRNMPLDDVIRERVKRAVGAVSHLRLKEFALFQLGLSERE